MKKRLITKIKIPILLLFLYSITLYFVILFLIPHSSETASFYEIRPKKQAGQPSLFLLFILLPLFTRYLLNIFISPFYEISAFFNQDKSLTKQIYQPLVTVLVPAWNEEVGIATTIKSVIKNNYKKKELIIIDDGSTDNTRKEVKKFIKKYHGTTKIIYLYKKNGGKASALNLGIAKASGEIVITMDADSSMEKNSITHFVKKFKNPKVMSVAGNVKIGNSANLLGLAQTAEYLSGFYFKKADSILNTIYIVGGAAAAYRKSVFETVGNFDEKSLTEDMEMSIRLQDHGLKICYSAKAIVYTEGPKKFKDIVKQRLRWKWGRFETLYKYRYLFFNPKHNIILTMFILPLSLLTEIFLFFEIFLLSYLYFQMYQSGSFAILILSICLMSLVFSFQVAIDEKNKKRLSLIILAPVIWLIFYAIDFIEYNAQLKCLFNVVKKKQVRWQKWQRMGVFNQT